MRIILTFIEGKARRSASLWKRPFLFQNTACTSSACAVLPTRPRTKESRPSYELLGLLCACWGALLLFSESSSTINQACKREDSGGLTRNRMTWRSCVFPIYMHKIMHLWKGSYYHPMSIFQDKDILLRRNSSTPLFLNFNSGLNRHGDREPPSSCRRLRLRAKSRRCWRAATPTPTTPIKWMRFTAKWQI